MSKAHYKCDDVQVIVQRLTVDSRELTQASKEKGIQVLQLQLSYYVYTITQVCSDQFCSLQVYDCVRRGYYKSSQDPVKMK